MESDRQETSAELEQESEKTENSNIGNIVGNVIIVVLLVGMIFIPGVLVGMWYGESLPWIGWAAWVSWVSGAFAALIFSGWLAKRHLKDWKGLYTRLKDNYNNLNELYETLNEEHLPTLKLAGKIIDKWKKQQEEQNSEVEDFILDFFDVYSGITNIDVKLNNDDGPPYIKIGDDEIMVSVDVSTEDGKMKDFASRLEKAHLEWLSQQN